MNRLMVKRILHEVYWSDWKSRRVLVSFSVNRKHTPLGEGRFPGWGNGWSDQGKANFETETFQGRVFADQRTGNLRANGRLAVRCCVPALQIHVFRNHSVGGMRMTFLRAAVFFHSRDAIRTSSRRYPLGVFGKCRNRGCR